MEVTQWKFNRKHIWGMSENTGVKDLMPQIEAKFEQPPVKLQSKYEMDMMNANMKIEQNQQELQKVQ